MGLALHTTLYQVGQQRLEDVGTVLHPALQGHHDQAGHVDAVAHREVAVGLEGADEEEKEGLVHDELAEHAEALLLPYQVRPVPLQDAVVLNA